MENGASSMPLPFQMPKASPHVYSCFVVNQTAEPIECSVNYVGHAGERKYDEVISVTIAAHAEYYFPRQFYQPDLPESHCKWVKTVEVVHVKKLDGKILEIQYPFKDVYFPVRNWEFHVNDEENILSKQPTRVVNVLKYKYLDQYEC